MLGACVGGYLRATKGKKRRGRKKGGTTQSHPLNQQVTTEVAPMANRIYRWVAHCSANLVGAPAAKRVSVDDNIVGTFVMTLVP